MVKKACRSAAWTWTWHLNHITRLAGAEGKQAILHDKQYTYKPNIALPGLYSNKR